MQETQIVSDRIAGTNELTALSYCQRALDWFYLRSNKSNWLISETVYQLVIRYFTNEPVSLCLKTFCGCTYQWNMENKGKIWIHGEERKNNTFRMAINSTYQCEENCHKKYQHRHHFVIIRFKTFENYENIIFAFKFC